MPCAAAAIAAAKIATSIAPRMPAAIPPDTHNPRPSAPRLAAMTIPTISAASSTSRKTMMAVASIGALLLHYQAAARCLIEIVKELIGTGIERPDKNADLTASRDDLLAVQDGALEFGIDHLLILDDQLDFDPSGNGNIARYELMILDRDQDLCVGGDTRHRCDDEEEGGKSNAIHGLATAQVIIVLNIRLVVNQSQVQIVACPGCAPRGLAAWRSGHAGGLRYNGGICGFMPLTGGTRCSI